MDKNDEWLAIPGLSRYKINRNNGAVISTCRGKIQCLSTKRNTVQMRTETGLHIRTTLPRVLYCAIHGINIRDIPSKAVIRMNEAGEPELISRERLNKEVINALRSSSPRVDVLQEYKKSIEFIELVLSCYKSGDFAPIAAKIQSMKGLVINYIKKDSFYLMSILWIWLGTLFPNWRWMILSIKKNDSYAGVLFKNYFPFIRGTKEAIPA